MGWSGGATPALDAAAQSDVVNALANFEPTMGSVMDDQERVALLNAVSRMGELAAEGRLTERLRLAARGPFNDEEMIVVEDAGYWR